MAILILPLIVMAVLVILDQGLSNNFQNLHGIRALSDNKLIIVGSKDASSGSLEIPLSFLN